MPEITIHRHIAHSEQGLYLLVPFEMPANTARIDVCYSYPKLAREPLTVPEEVFFSKKKPDQYRRYWADRAGWLAGGSERFEPLGNHGLRN